LSWPLKSETEIWEVAASNLARAELPKKVEIVVGSALDTLPKADRSL
jgi:predicted O-methyltransferase YrrM